MHALGIHTLCMCVFHRSMARQNERAALAHMPRISASAAPARDRTRTQERKRVPIYMPGLCIDVYMYIFIHDVCVGCISRRTYPRAHVMATAASSARAIARACAFEAVQPHARPYPPLTQAHTYLYIYIYMYNEYIYTKPYMHTYIPSFVRAAIPTHVHTRASACPHVCAHTRARIGGAAAHKGPRRIDDPPSASRPRWRASRSRKAAHTPKHHSCQHNSPNLTLPLHPAPDKA
jgi:hypothetical protein